MKPRLITHVLWTLHRAGAERMVFLLASRLPALGFSVRVIAAGGGGEMARDFLEAGVPVAVGPETVRRQETICFVREQLRLARPSLLHTHLGGDLWAGYVAWRDRVRPWICTAHNEDRDDRPLMRLLRGLAYRHADRVICVSEAVQHFVQTTHHVPTSHLEVVRNGVDLSQIPERQGMTLFRDTPRLLTVGRLVPQKGHETLLRALEMVKRPWRLEVYGAGPLRQELERLAASLGILARVHFRGSDAQIAMRYAEADLFCFPSLWEGQGLALLEAAAARVPILTSDLPVFHETFDASSLAFAKAGSVESWAKAMSVILSDPLHAMQRAERAQTIVRSIFPVDHMVRAYAELYERLGV